MISVIICSINKAFALQVQEKISDTIGVPWEAVIIDNTQSRKSITHVYNIGAAKAQYDMLCFVHEDLLFQTENWGRKLLDYFNSDQDLGLVGVAGSRYKSKTLSGWYTGCPELDCCRITHRDRTGHQEVLYLNPFPGSNVQQVIVLDGVFLCCPKKIWEEVRFDDVLLKDFHLYDLDFSFRVAEKYKVMVSFEIDIIHIIKGGHFGNKWLESTLQWHKKMQKNLPGYIPGINLNSKELEKKILRTWLIRLKHENIDFYNRLNWLLNIKIWAHISAWPFVFLFLVKNSFKKKQGKNG